MGEVEGVKDGEGEVDCRDVEASLNGDWGTLGGRGEGGTGGE